MCFGDWLRARGSHPVGIFAFSLRGWVLVEREERRKKA
jgi:hypothetical protein